MSPHNAARFCRVMNAIEHSPWLHVMATVAVMLLIIAGLNR